MATQQPQLKIGDYELVRLLGKGGMGDVWMASDTRADRPVALKFIKPHLLDDPAFRNRFLNEARTLGRLEHDRIVTLYNVVESGTHLALVLRFIDGESLADRIDAQGALPLDFVLASARDLLPALGFAHERGIIHRDIKPQNVLVDRQGRSFLTDFGIAVGDFAERSTMTGFAVGTPHYMSPEQIQTPRALTIQAGGHRSDIYSFGLVLFEMLTGSVPFGGDSGPEEMYRIQHAHCMEAPPRLRDLNPNVPAAVEAVVLRCLEKDPNLRPQSCAELLKEFEGAVNGAAPPVRSAPARSGTVVEAQPAPAPRPIDQRSPSPSRARRGVPKAAWLSLGGLVMAASIGYIALTPQKPVEQPAKGNTVVEKPPQQKTPDTKPVTPPKDGNVRPAPPPGPSAEEVRRTQQGAEARKSYEQAMLLQRQGKPCDAQTAMEAAVARDPANAEYARLQSAAASACRAAGFYKQAGDLYQQGEYCSAKSAIDQAVKLQPSNPDYLALQSSASKGCRTNLQ